jgi:hypothetical protein
MLMHFATGGVGGFITVLFYVAIVLFGCAILVFYGFSIYKNGAIMDSVWRLYVARALLRIVLISQHLLQLCQ